MSGKRTATPVLDKPILGAFVIPGSSFVVWMGFDAMLLNAYQDTIKRVKRVKIALRSDFEENKVKK